MKRRCDTKTVVGKSHEEGIGMFPLKSHKSSSRHQKRNGKSKWKWSSKPRSKRETFSTHQHRKHQGDSERGWEEGDVFWFYCFLCAQRYFCICIFLPLWSFKICRVGCTQSQGMCVKFVSAVEAFWLLAAIIPSHIMLFWHMASQKDGSVSAYIEYLAKPTADNQT